jgi:hypothetical protein
MSGAERKCSKHGIVVQARELNSMLKAWEAMRLSKDAQIAALMDRCKRYDEDAAEKGRSLEALRRKLAHHSTAPAPSTRSTSSVATSLTGAPSEGASAKARHVHLHMHGPPADGPFGGYGAYHVRDGTSGSSAIGSSNYDRHRDAGGSDAVAASNSYMRSFS